MGAAVDARIGLGGKALPSHLVDAKRQVLGAMADRQQNGLPQRSGLHALHAADLQIGLDQVSSSNGRSRRFTVDGIVATLKSVPATFRIPHPHRQDVPITLHDAALAAENIQAGQLVPLWGDHTGETTEHQAAMITPVEVAQGVQPPALAMPNAPTSPTVPHALPNTRAGRGLQIPESVKDFGRESALPIALGFFTLGLGIPVAIALHRLGIIKYNILDR